MQKQCLPRRACFGCSNVKQICFHLLFCCWGKTVMWNLSSFTAKGYQRDPTAKRRGKKRQNLTGGLPDATWGHFQMFAPAQLLTQEIIPTSDLLSAQNVKNTIRRTQPWEEDALSVFANDHKPDISLELLIMQGFSIWYRHTFLNKDLHFLFSFIFR